ncbi:MAG: hypothetical protein LUO79_08315 [Methanomassiliicoccales archaeon]|nr:hypothetical protein [Methanomassiliicoccales archaeon]
MDHGHILRRLVHMCTPLFLVYYWLPEPLWPGGLTKEQGLVILLVIVLALEVIRLRRQWEIIGIRDYEYGRMSAAAWAAIAMVFTFLFFPFQLAAPVLIGMAFVDPLIGELRYHKSKLYPLLPIIVYFGLVLGTLSLLIAFDARAIVATILATAAAIYLEKMRWRYLDDDFLMIVPPLLIIAAVYWLTSWPF